MPSNRLNSWLRKPLAALAHPGMYLVYKYHQLKRQHTENSRRKVTERELDHLNHKIDKLLAKLDEHETTDSIPTSGAAILVSEEEECVVCLNARATMQTFPCGHRVVCRKCFVKTIQVAVAQRCLPLKCVVCRSRVLKLKQIADEPMTPQPRHRHFTTSSGAAGDLPSPSHHHHHGGFRVPRPSFAKHFFSGSKSRGSSSTTSSQASMMGAASGEQPGARYGTPTATKLMQPMLIYPSQTSPKQQRAFMSDVTPASPMSKVSRGSRGFNHGTPQHRRGASASPDASAASSPHIPPGGAAAAALPEMKHDLRFRQLRDSRHAHLLSPRFTRCTHCSPNIHPSPRPSTISRHVKGGV